MKLKNRYIKVYDFVSLATFLILLLKVEGIRYRTSEENQIIKMNRNYIRDSTVKDVEYYKTMMFKEMNKPIDRLIGANIGLYGNKTHLVGNEQKEEILTNKIGRKEESEDDVPVREKRFKTILNITNKTHLANKTRKSQIKSSNSNQTESELYSVVKDMRRNFTLEKIKSQILQRADAYGGDYYTAKRFLKFYISQQNKCDVIIDDIMQFANVSPKTKLIEHMILHNNAEEINPISVVSEDLNIISFAFNKKINIFSVFYDNPRNISEPTVTFKYLAENLIKTNVRESETDGKKNETNSFIWKVVNQNLINVNEKMKVEVFFDAVENVDPNQIKFSLNFTNITPISFHTNQNYDDKNRNLRNELSNQTNDNQNSTSTDHFMVKYLWKGALKMHEVIVLEVTFPMIFEACGNISINLFIVGVGAVFIIFLIGMLFFIFSSIFFEEV